ncbi:MAG: carboxypeptidase regulatory-like domain-containing protein [Flavobacteriales bacterium]|nr:carboxypeptidase regulatory-like domain-containing protein [Flavobacteriales bacterium]
MIFLLNSALANISVSSVVTDANGVSADRASNATSPVWTVLSQIRLDENNNADFPSNQTNGTFKIVAPAGYSFNQFPANAMTATPRSGRAITSASIVWTSATVLTVTYTTNGTNQDDRIDFNFIEIRADDGGNVPGTGNITFQDGTGGTIAGLNNFVCGNVSQVVGAHKHLFITLPGQTFTDANTKAGSGNSGAVSNQKAGTSFVITRIRATDQFYNVVTSYSGAKTIVYSGPGTSASAPVYTTNVSFTSGASTTTLTTTLNKTEVTTITATQGTFTGPASSSIVVGLPTPTHVINGPYLVMGKSTGMNIRWRTHVRHQARVWYGLTRGTKTNVADQNIDTTEHEVSLTGLSPNTKYYYAIGSTAGDTLESSDSNFFYTSPTIGTDKDTRVWVLGDCGRNNTHQQNTRDAYYSYTSAKHTDLVLLLGDNAYDNGTDNEYRDKFFNLYEPAILKKSPLFPCPGNHDYNNGSSVTPDNPYHKLFTVPKGGEIGGTASNAQSYYSFDHANIHFVSLDSYGEVASNKMYDTTGAQAIWLKQDLAATTQKWKVLYWHHPPYTMGSHNSDNESDLVAIRNRFVRMLERFDVDLILVGHSHNYERTKLINGYYGNEASYNSSYEVSSSSGRYVDNSSCAYVKSSTDHQGTVYVVAGSAGTTGSTQAAYPHNAMYYSESSIGGTAVLDINSNRLRLKYLNKNGVVTDSFTMFKDVNTWSVLNINDTVQLTASWPGTYNWSPSSSGNRTINVGTTSQTYVVADNQGCLADTFIVNPPNVPPVANNDTKAAVSSQPVVINVQANDYDPYGQTFTTSIIEAPAHGNAVVNGGNTITYTADDFYAGPDTIVYQICDAGNLCDTGYVFLTVTAAPVATGPHRYFKGQLFLDRNSDGLFNDAIFDKFGAALIRVRIYKDLDSNGVVGPSDFLQESTTDLYGKYFMELKAGGRDTVTYTVEATNDDAEQTTSGTMNRNSTDLEMFNDGSEQYVGIRFNNIKVNPGDTILAAYITMYPDASEPGNSTNLAVNIFGFDEDNTQEFAGTANDMSGRPLTTATRRWPLSGSLPTWPGSLTPQVSTDVSNIVQEIVDRAGWAYGNSVGFRMERVSGLSGLRRADNYDGGNPCKLTLIVGKVNVVPRHGVVKLVTGDLFSSSVFTTDTIIEFNSTLLADTTTYDFGYIGPRTQCFLVADGADNSNTVDELHMVNRKTGSSLKIGSTGTVNIESCALVKNMDTLYSVDGDQFGWINMETGAFTSIGSAMGTISGVIGTSTTSINISDVDGLTYDAANDILWAVERRSGTNKNDLIFQINRTTGQPKPNTYGSNVGYKEIKGTDILSDVDDIGMMPVTGVMYGSNNNGGSNNAMITLDPWTGIATKIGVNGISDIEGMGYYNDGEIYGTTGKVSAATDNTFYEISKVNGDVTQIGPIGFTSGATDVEGCDCFTGTSENLLAGYVFWDENVSGTFNANEEIFPNHKVYLYKDSNANGIWDSNDQLVDSTVTSALGHYAFLVDTLGRYLSRPKITGTILTNLTTTTTDSITEKALFTSYGQYDGNNNFGFIDTRIGDRVWLDLDKDGEQDSGEPGVSGVVVTLYKSGTDSIVSTTITDAYGYYLFNLVNPGNYTVGFTLPPNYGFTTQTNTADNTDGTKPKATGSDANVYTGRTYAFNIGANESELNIDAGLVFLNDASKGSIGDFVWLDNNTNGVQDAGEPGVSGVTVTLYNSAGTTPIATTVTDANGFYEFTNVDPGTYRVGFSLPPGMQYTTNSGGVSATGNSDAGTTPGLFYGKTGTFTLSAGETISYVDAGLKLQNTASSSIGDRVWYDNNRNGVQDAGEPGIEGVMVILRDSTNTAIDSVKTDAFGNYVFNNLSGKKYYVQFRTPSGMTPTSRFQGTASVDSDPDVTTGITNLITLASGERNMTIDAGYYSTSSAGSVGALGDYVWNDLDGDGVQDAGEPGIPGVRVILYNNSNVAVDTVTTDDNGFYLFTNITPGSYSVGFDNLPSNYKFTTADAGGNDNLDSDVNPVTGRTGSVNVTGGSTITNLDAGLIEGKPSGLASLGNRVWIDLPVTSGGTNGNGIQDAGEPGVAGITVELLNSSGNSIDPDGAGPLTKTTTITNALGEYMFTGLSAGSYIVQFGNIPSGYTLTSQNAGSDDNLDSDGGALGTGGAPSGFSRTAIIALSAGEENLSVDLGIKPPANTNTLGNYVWFDADKDGIQDASEAGVPGVTVTLLNSSNVPIASTSTDINGLYKFTGLADGDYSVIFSNLPDNMTFTTQSGTNTNNGSDADVITGATAKVTLNSSNRNDNTLDAGLNGNTAMLGDYVWFDENGDGIQDSTEAGVAGVTVSLYNSLDSSYVSSAITDQNGKYLFPNLLPGNYFMRPETYPGYQITTKDATAESAGTDSDVDPTTNTTANIKLDAGTINLKIDAGLTPSNTATIGNRVWHDINKDGVQDAGEPGLAGVVVRLYNSSNVEIGSAVTDGNGNWSMTNVPPGTGYYLVFDANMPNFNTTGTPGNDPAWTTQNVGTNGADGLSSGTESDTDSDVGASGGNAGTTATFDLAAGDNFVNMDAGIINASTFTPVPVKWLNFDAVLINNNKDVLLNWSTATEINNSHFEVERSLDAVNFTNIGRVESKSVSGNSNFVLNYDLIDLKVNQLGPNVIYYRIKQVDFDGEYSYSHIEVINLKDAGLVKVYPSPIKDDLTITFGPDQFKNKVKVTINDMTGRTVYEKMLDVPPAGQFVESISFKHLDAGYYSISISDERETKVFKVYKQ